jgi:hypothetical protein
VGAAIRLYDLGGSSLWFDEAWAYTIATMPWGAMWHVIFTREANRGLFYFLLSVWIPLFGSSEAR